MSETRCYDRAYNARRCRRCGQVLNNKNEPDSADSGDGICLHCLENPPFTRADQEGLEAEADYWEGVIRGDA